MKNIFLYLIFLICSQSYCQVKDSIRYISFPEKRKDFVVNKLTKKDTIYMIFEEKENQRKHSTKKKDRIISYSYNYDFKKGNVLYFTTGIIDSITSEFILFGKIADTKWIDRKYIRKNKIYSYEKINKKGFNETVEEISDCTFYLIEINTKKNGKYKAMEVGSLFPIEL
jgi:hypothetical protein